MFPIRFKIFTGASGSVLRKRVGILQVTFQLAKIAKKLKSKILIHAKKSITIAPPEMPTVFREKCNCKRPY